MNKIDLSHNRLSVMNNKTHGLFDDCLSLRKVGDTPNSPTTNIQIALNLIWVGTR